MLREVSAIYQIAWERSTRVKVQIAPIDKEIKPISSVLVAQRDNHVKAWFRWRKEQARAHRLHLQELQRKDDLETAAMRKRVRETQHEIRNQKKRAKAQQIKDREYATLIELLDVIEEGQVRNALLNTWSNIEMIWERDGEEALNHHGRVLTMEERNRLQHSSNRNIKETRGQRKILRMTVKPYDRPKGPTIKKPKSSKLWENYYFEEELSKIPNETKSEEEVRFYGWRWMVYASTMNMRTRDDGARFNPLRPIEEQPGWCYLRLFKKEYHDIIDWPSFLTLMEMCSWEIKLRDPDVLVGFVKPAGSNIWHIEA